MEMLEKVELVREKCNVSYEEARDALVACGGDVLDAIVMLEQSHEVTERRVASVPPAPDAAYEIPDATEAGATFATESEPAYESAESRTSKAKSAWKRFCAQCCELWRAGMKTSFVAERNDEVMFEMPVLLVVLGLLFWGASLWMLIVGLFLGFRYHIEGTSKMAEGVNDAMGKAADAASDIKESIA